MAQNPQSQAIQIANQLITLSASLLSVYNQIVALDASWTDNGTANTISKLGTVALNPDGSTSTTPDTTPNPANPIDPTKYPTLQRSMSSNQIASLKTVLDPIVSYVNGVAIPATPGVRGILNSASGG